MSDADKWRLIATLKEAREADVIGVTMTGQYTGLQVRSVCNGADRFYTAQPDISLYPPVFMELFEKALIEHLPSILDRVEVLLTEDVT